MKPSTNLTDSALTSIHREEDVPYLRTKLLDVNMRLFRENSEYRKFVQAACQHLSRVALTKFDDYTTPFGISGANVAIPFNIIAVVYQRGTKFATALAMINPRIRRYLGEPVQAASNCGSIRLDKPIKVWRHPVINLDWYDTDGRLENRTFTRKTGSFTIQHEVDHNQGILITDRQRS